VHKVGGRAPTHPSAGACSWHEDMRNDVCVYSEARGEVGRLEPPEAAGGPHCCHFCREGRQGLWAGGIGQVRCPQGGHTSAWLLSSFTGCLDIHHSCVSYPEGPCLPLHFTTPHMIIEPEPHQGPQERRPPAIWAVAPEAPGKVTIQHLCSLCSAATQNSWVGQVIKAHAQCKVKGMYGLCIW
jgi:hypothetical protein